ncbi:SPOR domain-containing protein [Acidisoma cladoniae]|jgi:rare lipoprotein A|uniref:SPOR domain-containing protein n=1 Tax=Acidisoma cladoniae TaxID=3040935 RepID=UPI00254F689A|nr:SPOR domain-containing protein [Acidisoma sp. PAMC 29798]
MKLTLAFATALVVAGCTHRAPPVASHPVYTIGSGYEAQGVWHYPREDLGYTRTGLASVYGDDAPSVTADGEGYDPDAMTGAHPTLQLPAIVQVTNLQTGRQLLLRLNDRGPADPGRILEVTPKAADLLGIPADGAAEVRIVIQQGPSQALADSLGGGIKIAAAPVTGFQSASLAPPAGVAQSGGNAVGPSAGAGEQAVAQAVPPLDLPVTLTQGPADPGSLYIQSGSFGRQSDAWRASAGLSGLPNAHVIALAGEGRTLYGVLTGPYPSVPQADAALASTLRSGGIDATIVVR